MNLDEMIRQSRLCGKRGGKKIINSVVSNVIQATDNILSDVKTEINQDAIDIIQQLKSQNDQLIASIDNLHEEYQNKLSTIEQTILAKEKAEQLMRVKLRERQMSLENKQAESIKNKIEENQLKIKEIENKQAEDEKNQRLTALSQGKSPNKATRQIPKKSSYNSLKKKIGKDSSQDLPKVE